MCRGAPSAGIIYTKRLEERFGFWDTKPSELGSTAHAQRACSIRFPERKCLRSQRGVAIEVVECIVGVYHPDNGEKRVILFKVGTMGLTRTFEAPGGPA